MKRYIFLLLLIATLFLCSCENFEWFKSEKGIKKQLEGTWQREFLTDTTAQEYWHFAEGKLNVITLAGSDTTDKNTVDFTVDAGITTSYVKTPSIQVGDYTQSLKWSIVILDNDALYLVAEKDGSLLQREFAKK